MTFPDSTLFKPLGPVPVLFDGFILNIAKANIANKNKENKVINVVDTTELVLFFGRYNKKIGNKAINEIINTINHFNPNNTFSFGFFIELLMMNDDCLSIYLDYTIFSTKSHILHGGFFPVTFSTQSY